VPGVPLSDAGLCGARFILAHPYGPLSAGPASIALVCFPGFPGPACASCADGSLAGRGHSDPGRGAAAEQLCHGGQLGAAHGLGGPSQRPPPAPLHWPAPGLERCARATPSGALAGSLARSLACFRFHLGWAWCAIRSFLGRVCVRVYVCVLEAGFGCCRRRRGCRRRCCRCRVQLCHGQRLPHHDARDSRSAAM
jgi:hypothetical protein